MLIPSALLCEVHRARRDIVHFPIFLRGRRAACVTMPSGSDRIADTGVDVWTRTGNMLGHMHRSLSLSLGLEGIGVRSCIVAQHKKEGTVSQATPAHTDSLHQDYSRSTTAAAPMPVPAHTTHTHTRGEPAPRHLRVDCIQGAHQCTSRCSRTCPAGARARAGWWQSGAHPCTRAGGPARWRLLPDSPVSPCQPPPPSLPVHAWPRTAQRVDAVRVEAEGLNAVGGLRRKRLVQLEHVNVVLGQAHLLQHLGDRHRRPCAAPHRTQAGQHIAL
jgi:hypothetical protein